MKRFSSFIFCLITGVSYSQTLETEIVCALPSALLESSSLEIDSDGNFWSANDSGNDPVIYHFDSTGTILHTIFITNASNTDWEDMALSPDGTLYIGNFGNNLNNRLDLAILSLSTNNLLPGDNYREVGFIGFSYEEQHAFPPPEDQLNFDCEALIFKNDSLFFFTKNRTVPFSGYTYMYAVPAFAGNYSVTRLDSCWIGADEYSGRVTSGDLSDEGRLVLLSMTQVILFDDTTVGSWLHAAHNFRNLSTFTQKEAVCWADSCTLYFTDEFFDDLLPGGKLYSSALCDQDPLSCFTIEMFPADVFPQPANNDLTVNFVCGSAANKLSLKFRSIDGKMMGEFPVSATGAYHVNTSSWADGIYTVTAEGAQRSISRRILIIH